MKATEECYECLQRLVHQAAELATDDVDARQRAVTEGLTVLEDHFSCDEVSIVIATKIHKVIRNATRNPDPYRGLKEREILVARELCAQIDCESVCELIDCVKLAALGNAIDFFRSLEAVKKDMELPVRFAVDDTERFGEMLRRASKVLYLADNAGEVFFDLPAVRWMRRFAQVTYVIKSAPVQDDMTPMDITYAGVGSEVGRMITTGTATPGIDFREASSQFKREYEDADLVFAKGMGYYESLSELPPIGKVFHCLKAKCNPVAHSLGVPIGSYVALLR